MAEGEGEQEVPARIKELEEKVGALKAGCDSVADAVTNLETSAKAAYALAEKYLQPKRGGMPDDTVKKVDELKKSVTAYDKATKELLAATEDGVKKLKAQSALAAAELESARMEDESETPEGLKKQIDAMKVELQRQVEEKDEIETTLREEMNKLLTQSNEEKEELVKKHTDAVNELQGKNEDLTDQLEIVTQKFTLEQEQTASLKAAVEDRDAKIVELTSRADRLEAEAALANQSAKEFKSERDILAAQFKVAETCRSNEFKAFERSVAAHEDEIIGWEKKLAEAQRATETMRAEREAMRTRLVDDHLREHIRVLQAENNQLREERIRDNHQRATETTQGADLSSVLSAQLREGNKERSYFEGRIESLSTEIAAKEKALFDVTMALETERSDHTAKVEALERQLRAMEFSPKKMEVELEKMKATADRPPITRHVSTQATDMELLQAKSKVSLLQSSANELQDRLDVVTSLGEEQRRELENKLLSEAEQSASEINILSNQLKAARFRISRLQKELTEQRSASPEYIDPYEADEQALNRRKKLEKQAVEASLEAEGLRVRVRTLQRELEEQRDVYEQQLEELRYPLAEADAAPPVAHAAGGSGGNSPIPDVDAYPSRSVSEMSQTQQAAERRAQRQAEIDDKLLRLHEESLKLDEKEANVQQRRESSEQQIRDRMKWIESALTFWRSANGELQRGPDGETNEQMITKLVRERAQLEEQLQQVEDGMVRFFKEVGDRRSKMFQASNALLEERASL